MSEGIEFLEERITQAIDYAGQEFELSNAEVVGLLELIKQEIVMDSFGVLDSE